MSSRLRPFLSPIFLILSLLGLLLLSQQPWNRAVQATPGMPGVKPASGRYAGPVTVALRSTHPRGQIVYTLDGSEPTAEVGSLYTDPLHLAATGATVLRAVEVVAGEAGPVRTATYIVEVDGKLPVLSIALPPVSLWDAETGILANLTWRGAEWEREAAVTYILADGTVGFSSPVGLRVDNEGAKPDLRLYFRSEYDAARLTYPLFPQHSEQSVESQSYKRLLLLGGHPGDDLLSNAEGGLWQDALANECASDVGLRTAQGRAVHLFINGESWGLYYLSERVDRFFLEDNYGYERADAVREGKTVEGDDADWDALIDWVVANDLAEPEYYAYVQSQIDVSQLIDTAILYFYLDLPPDAFIAVRPQLGRWEWLYAGGGEMSVSQVHAGEKSDLDLLYSALLANEEFRHAFAIRTADLLNTVLSPAQMQTRISALDAAWGEDYNYERGRWFYGDTWEQEMLAMQQWGAQRADFLYDLVQDHTGLSGDVPFTFAVNPPDAGMLYSDDMRLETDSEMVTRYFAGTVVTVTAQAVRWPLPGYQFTGWEICEGQTCREIAGSPELALTIDMPQQITANFAACSPGVCDVAANDVIISEYWINDNGTRYSSLDNRGIEGDWVELRVMRDGVDMRGWRLTDNDSVVGSREGSIIFPDHPALASLDKNTIILLITTQNNENAQMFPEDDLDNRDRRLLYYVGNGNLDVTTDPDFGIGQRDDNLALLAPGQSDVFSDDVGIDFVAEGKRVTPYSFGILGDGVSFPVPFGFLGRDDGASWQKSGNPDQVTSWHVDPSACNSGDADCWGERNEVMPGR